MFQDIYGAGIRVSWRSARTNLKRSVNYFVLIALAFHTGLSSGGNWNQRITLTPALKIDESTQH